MASAQPDSMESTEKALDETMDFIKVMPKHLRLFSLSMRALYTDKAVGSDSEASKKFRKLRDDTRDDAMVYMQCMLPLTTKFVGSLSEFFDYYTALSFEDWDELLPDILEDTVAYKETAMTLKEMHEDILVPLKKKENDAKMIITEFKDLTMEFKKKKKAFEDSASTKRTFAEPLLMIPLINLIALPILRSLAEKDDVESIALGAEIKIHEAAAVAVADVLIPALQNFIGGLEAAAGFFEVMEEKLRQFTDAGKKGEKATVARKKKLYFQLVEKKAKAMTFNCDAFFAVLPAVRTDFRAIPTEGTDQNYVDEWLEKQRKAIDEKISLKRYVKYLLSYLSSQRQNETTSEHEQEVVAYHANVPQNEALENN